MNRKIVVVIFVCLVLFFSMIIPADIFTLSEKNDDFLDGGLEPLGTIEWRTLGRTWEPVVVAGSQVLDLVGTSVNDTDVFSLDNDIFVFVWNGTTETWKQIPFQVDERNSSTGSYGVNNSDGVLDIQDEIVFMAQDAGDRASLDEWVIGCDAPRYEVEIIDPDIDDKAWAYIYKSSKIEADFTEDYVRFDTTVNDVFTECYTMGFRDGIGMVADYFNVTEAYGGDGKDLADTLELVTFAYVGIFNLTYDENYLGEDFTLKKDGNVRALGVVNWHLNKTGFGITVETYFNFTWKFYKEHMNITGYLDVHIVGSILVDIWIALDHNGTSIPMQYRDLSGNTGVINGLEDDNIKDPIVQGWWEVASSHGGYLSVWNIDLICNSSKLIFDDDFSAEDHNNTEPGLYGRTGGYFENVTHDQRAFVNVSFFPIPSDVSGVAEVIANDVNNPLQIITTAQHSPTIWVEKDADVDYAKVGDSVDYIIYFNNTGDRIANSVWINDTLPLGVTFFEHDADSSPSSQLYFFSFNQIGNILYFEFRDVPFGEHFFTITVTVNPSAVAGEILTNWAFCNFTNELFQLMPESSASASFLVSASNCIVLKQGWNLISIPAIQDDTNLKKVLENISDYYDAVQFYNNSDYIDSWKHYKLEKSYGNDLFELNKKMGFWVHIIPPGLTIFYYNGTQPAVEQTIDLYPGWNLVGYPSLTSHNRTDGLNNINFGPEVDSIWTYDVNQNWDEIDASEYFELGKGYWIHSKVTVTWIVPL